MPPSFWMSSVASACTTSTMSSKVTMPFMWPSASTTGIAIRSFSVRTLETDLLVLVVAHAHELGAHHVAHALLGLGREQVAERDDADQLLRVVDHVQVGDDLEVGARLPAQVADRLVDGHLGAHPRVARVHQPAGLVLL